MHAHSVIKVLCTQDNSMSTCAHTPGRSHSFVLNVVRALDSQVILDGMSRSTRVCDHVSALTVEKVLVVHRVLGPTSSFIRAPNCSLVHNVAKALLAVTTLLDITRKCTLDYFSQNHDSLESIYSFTNVISVMTYSFVCKSSHFTFSM